MAAAISLEADTKKNDFLKEKGVEVIDSASGVILDTRVISGLSRGVYLNWTVSGQIMIKVKSAIRGKKAFGESSNGVISGIFID